MKIKGLLNYVEAVPEPERDIWLRKECAGDELLCQQVRALLQQETPKTENLLKPLRKDSFGYDLAGKILGSWRLLKQLGKGGMGEVWLAERADEAFSMFAAIKMARGSLGSAEILARFKRERQLLADLKHPHIASLYDGGTTEEGTPFLVMEFVPGKTIDVWCREHKPDICQLLQMFRQLCLAVAYAHRKGVLHRDIKPINVMVDSDSHVKLMDFGIASIEDDDITALTAGAIAPMTPEYASPERLQGKPVTEAADIYALGLVLFHLLTGKKPRDVRDDYVSVMQRWFDQCPHDLGSLGTFIPRLLDSVPMKRPHSVEEIIREIDACLFLLNEPNCQTDHITHEVMIWYDTDSGELVEQIARRLEVEHQLHPWLDRWHQLGRNDRALAMAEALSGCAALLVILGGSDRAPWSDSTFRDLICSAQNKLRRRTVPLLIAGAQRPDIESELPVFLRRLKWLNLEDVWHSSLDELARVLRGLTPLPPDPEIASVCPFRGLQAFREEDACFFFGREALIQRLETHMRKRRFLSVLGPSGSGKSSVVQAGLIPSLRCSGYAIGLFTPTANPMTELAFTLASLFPEPACPEGVLQRLQDRPESLYFIMRELISEGSLSKLCLVIDQFEELFTLADENETDHFLTRLFYALQKEKVTLSVVITLRSDFLGRCVRWPELNSFVVDYMMQVGPMDRDELARAMTEPARRAGLCWEKGLYEKILQDVACGPAELPLLEHALLELYEHRRGRTLTAIGYTRIGGIEGALAYRAESLFQILDLRGQDLVRKMFTLCLLTPGDGSEDTRRRATRAELLTIAECGETASQLLDRFIDARLLTARHDMVRNSEQIVISHEALIRSWWRIRQWMEEDREAARRLCRLRRRAKAWDEVGRLDDFLLRGGELYQMVNLSKQAMIHLGELEDDYIQAGLQLEDHEGNVKRRTRNLLATLTLIAVIFASISYKSSLEAKHASRDAQQAEIIALEEKKRAVQKTLEANYHLGIAFNEKAGVDLEKNQPERAWFGSLAALSMVIPADRALPEPMGRFLDGRMSEIERMLWTSPAIPHVRHARIDNSGRMLALAGEDALIRLIDRHTGLPRGHFSGVIHGITALEISPDGQWLAAGSDRDQVYLWRVEDGAFYTTSQKHRGKVSDLTFSPDSRLLASSDEHGQVMVMALENRQTVASHTFHSMVKALVFGQSASELFVAVKGDLYRFGLRAETIERQGRVVPGEITALAWNNTSGLVSGWTSGDVIIHGRDGSESLIGDRQHPGPVLSLANAPGGAFMVSSAADEVYLWARKTSRPRAQVIPGLSGLISMDIDDNGILVACDAGGKMYRMNLLTQRPLPLPEGHRGEIRDLDISPDGRTVASGASDGIICLWDSEGRLPVRSLEGNNGTVYGVAFSPDGKWLASASADGKVRLWDLMQSSDGAQPSIELTGHTAKVVHVAFSPDGQRLASSSFDHKVRIWRLGRGEDVVEEAVLDCGSNVQDLAFSPNNDLLVAGCNDRLVRIWDLSKPDGWQKPKLLRGHQGMVYGLAFSPNGSFLATASYDQTVRLWPVNGKQVYDDPRVFPGHNASVHQVAFSPDGHLLASSSEDQTIRLWDIHGRAPPLVLKGHAATVSDVVFSPDGTRLISSSYDRTVRIWDVASPFTARNPEILEGHRGATFAAAFSPDGKSLATVSKDKTVRFWHVSGGDRPQIEPGPILKGHKGTVYNLAFSPDGRTLATVSRDKTVRLWDTATPFPSEKQVLEGHDSLVLSVSFSPDGRYLASSAHDETIRLWRIESSGQAHYEQTLTGQNGAIFDVAFSPDGSLLASASEDGTVWFWNTEQYFQPCGQLEDHTGSVYSLAFSPDGTKIVTASEDQTVRLWDVDRLEALEIMHGHGSRVMGVTFTPDGTHLISTSADNTVGIWDARDGRPWAVLQGHLDEVSWSPAISPNGKILATASADTTIRLWYMNRLPQPPAGEDARAWYDVLLRRSLYHLGYRQEGFQFKPSPHIRMRLEGSSGFPGHLDRPRPIGVSLQEWLMSAEASQMQAGGPKP